MANSKLLKEMKKLGLNSQEDLENYIQNHLNYLESEGFVTKIGDKYRTKTKKESQKEVESIN